MTCLFLSFVSYVTVERNNKKAAFQNTGTNGAIIRAVFCLMRSKLLHTRGVQMHCTFTQVHCYVVNTFARRKQFGTAHTRHLTRTSARHKHTAMFETFLRRFALFTLSSRTKRYRTGGGISSRFRFTHGWSIALKDRWLPNARRIRYKRFFRCTVEASRQRRTSWRNTSVRASWIYVWIMWISSP